MSGAGWVFGMWIASRSGRWPTTAALPFLVMVAARLRFRTDELVLGAMMSAVAVTWFNFGARIVDYAQEFVASLAQVFVPMSSQSEAVGNLDRVRKIYIAGNRVCAFLILPITAILIIFGKHIIRIWVGARYVPHSYPVLVVMIIPFALMLAQAASGADFIWPGQASNDGGGQR